MGPIGPIVQGVSSRRKDSRGQRINIMAINFCGISNIVSAFFLSFKKMNNCIFFCHCNPSDNQLLKITINKDRNSLIAHYNYSSANDYRCLCQSGTRTKLQQQWPSKCQQLGTYLPSRYLHIYPVAISQCSDTTRNVFLCSNAGLVRTFFPIIELHKDTFERNTFGEKILYLVTLQYTTLLDR